jgi:hypothetical protein
VKKLVFKSPCCKLIWRLGALRASQAAYVSFLTPKGLLLTVELEVGVVVDLRYGSGVKSVVYLVLLDVLFEI